MLIDVDIISGFLGAGKTVLIKKLAEEVWADESVTVLENDFGDVVIDARFLSEKQLRVESLASGCICCSLVKDFNASLNKILNDQSAHRVVIEPSGVSKLSQIIGLVRKLDVKGGIRLNSVITVVDVTMFNDYMSLFGEFYADQIQNAGTIVCSRTQTADAELLKDVSGKLRALNHSADIITVPWDKADVKEIFCTAESVFSAELSAGTFGDPETQEEHGHHNGYDADDIFESWTFKTTTQYSESHLRSICGRLTDTATYGMVIRAKGVIRSGADKWLEFDFEPRQFEVRRSAPSETGEICVIGRQLNQNALHNLF